jgi:hypothetical protein
MNSNDLQQSPGEELARNALADVLAKARFYCTHETERIALQTRSRIAALQAYAAYYAQKKHTDKFGIKYFRVLTITSSAARCRNLVKAAEAADDVRENARLFRFAAEKDLPLSSPESVLDKIWIAPGRGQPCSIL